MKTLKAFVLTVAAIVLVAVFGCNGTNSSKEIRDVMARNLKIMEDFIITVENTEDTQVYLSALEKMKNDIEMLIPEMNDLNKKYPDLFKLNDKKEPSPELKDILKEQVEREEEVRTKFVAALQKMMNSANNAEIMKEFKEIYELQKKNDNTELVANP